MLFKFTFPNSGSKTYILHPPKQLQSVSCHCEHTLTKLAKLKIVYYSGLISIWISFVASLMNASEMLGSVCQCIRPCWPEHPGTGHCINEYGWDELRTAFSQSGKVNWEKKKVKEWIASCGNRALFSGSLLKKRLTLAASWQDLGIRLAQNIVFGSISETMYMPMHLARFKHAAKWLVISSLLRTNQMELNITF